MSNIAIRVEKLSKDYILGDVPRHDSLKELLTDGLHRVFGRNGQLPTMHATRDARSRHFSALRDVSFEVKRGERLGIIGPNGAGKSTLLKILARIIEPTAGRVRMRGRVGSLLEVGTGFDRELSGRENIYLNGSILGMRRWETEQKFADILEFSGIERFIDVPVKRYSTGMYVRLAFAVAAHFEPDIMLLDEVLSVGDAAFQKKCLAKMKDISKGGRTLLFVSHDMQAVRALCPQCLLIQEGKVAFAGSSDAAIARYLNLMGSPKELADYTVEVHLKDHAHGGTHVRFRRVSFRTPEGHGSHPVRYRHPFILRVEADFAEPVRACRLGLSIETLEGFRIATVYNTDCGDSPEDFEAGHAAWNILIPNILTPGTYVLGVNITLASDRSAIDGSGIEYIPASIPFHVSELDPDADSRSKYAEGPILLDARWSRNE